METTRIHILSGKDLKQVLTMADCIDAMQDAFGALYRGEVEVPLRQGIDMKPDNGTALFMPVYSSDIHRVGVKAIMLNNDNPARGIPFIHAMLMLFDAATGKPIALLDGEVVTAMRTGAVSGLATRLLAAENAKTAAIIGSGIQGETQLEAVCCARKIENAIVFDLDPERAASFADRMSRRLGIDVAAASVPGMLAEADVICTSTSSPKPVFDDAHIKGGAHINGVGSYQPHTAELPAETLLRAKIVVDRRQECLAEAGDLIQPINSGIFTAEHIHGDLGEVVAGKIAGRESETEVTVFKSVGIAVQDLAAADLALKLAEKAGVGQQIDI